MKNPFLKAFKLAMRPPEQITPWQWCEKYLVVDETSPMPGKWRSDNAPWVREFMECFSDNRVRIITVMCAAQSSKTQTLLNLLCWAIAEDPGPILWLSAARDELKEFIRDRVSPTFHHCAPVRNLLIGETVMGFEFTTTPVYFAGAGSKSKTKSKPIRYLLADEVEEYPPGHLQSALNRTLAYDSWNARRVLISTPHLKGGVMDTEFLKGDQRVFHFTCPACDQLQPLKWMQLKWNRNDTTHPGEHWDFDALAETIRYECNACNHGIRDTPAERKELARSGRFIRMNPGAPKYRVSFHWNALLPPWVSWRSLVEEFIHAQAGAQAGDVEPLKSFVNDKLGEGWTDELGIIQDWSFLDARREQYAFGDPWPEEKTRYLFADQQERGGEHFWYVCRAFGVAGKSRLMAYGRCNSRQELLDTAQSLNCPPAHCAVDTGQGRAAPGLYRFCASTGWNAFKGDTGEGYPVLDQQTRKSFLRLWKMVWADAALGTPMQGRGRKIKLFRFANNPVKDLLADFQKGQAGHWTIPMLTGRDYLEHNAAEHRIEVRDTKGRYWYEWRQVRRDNHLLDCERGCLVMALVEKMIIAQPIRAGGVIRPLPSKDGSELRPSTVQPSGNQTGNGNRPRVS